MNHIIKMIIIGTTVTATQVLASNNKTQIDGFVSHGINVYNNKFIADYSNTTPLIPWLNPVEPVREIGVYSPGDANAAPIDENTDRSLPVATIDDFANFFNPGGVFDLNLLNKTIDQIGTNFFGFASVDQRAPIIPFDQSTPGQIHRSGTANAQPTVGDWEKISGRLDINCLDDGRAVVRVTVKNAFPDGLYSLWDIGVFNPQTENEQGYGVPFGGIPNVLVTDNQGCGTKEFIVNYCPISPCGAGSDSCSSYISAFYHWDGQIYGGSPAATFAGAPAGVVSSNHIVWPMSGELLMEPKNKFKGGTVCDRKNLRI